MWSSHSPKAVAWEGKKRLGLSMSNSRSDSSRECIAFYIRVCVYKCVCVWVCGQRINFVKQSKVCPSHRNIADFEGFAIIWTRTSFTFACEYVTEDETLAKTHTQVRGQWSNHQAMPRSSVHPFPTQGQFWRHTYLCKNALPRADNHWKQHSTKSKERINLVISHDPMTINTVFFSLCHLTASIVAHHNQIDLYWVRVTRSRYLMMP